MTEHTHSFVTVFLGISCFWLVMALISLIQLTPDQAQAEGPSRNSTYLFDKK